MSAGNASPQKACSPEMAAQPHPSPVCPRRLCRPSGRGNHWCNEPRALPWAITCRPFRAVRAHWDSRVGVPELRSFGGCPRMTFRSKWWVSPNDANDGAVQLGGCPRIEVGTTRPTDAGSKWWVSPNDASGCPQMTLSVTRHLLQAVFARRQKKTIGFGRQCLHDPLLIR